MITLKGTDLIICSQTIFIYVFSVFWLAKYVVRTT